MINNALSTLDHVKHTAIRAGQLALGILTTLTTNDIRQKDGDFVTIADEKAQEAIWSSLQISFPDYGIIAEENGLNKPGKPINDRIRNWIIDPLDGTKNAIQNIPGYVNPTENSTKWATLIALEEKTPEGDSSLLVAVIYIPMENRILWALKGMGAFVGEIVPGNQIITEIQSLKTPPLTNESVRITYGGSKIQDPHLMNVKKHLSAKGYVLSFNGSIGYDMALIAQGKLDGLWRFNNAKWWDVAAGKLIIEEAGGIVSHNISSLGDMRCPNLIVGNNMPTFNRLENDLSLAYSNAPGGLLITSRQL